MAVLSFHGFVKNGFYDEDWGGEKQIEFGPDVGNELNLVRNAHSTNWLPSLTCPV